MENKNIVYVVVVDDVCEESFWSNVEVFRSFKNAKAHMDKLIEDFELEDLKDIKFRVKGKFQVREGSAPISFPTQRKGNRHSRRFSAIRARSAPVFLLFRQGKAQRACRPLHVCSPLREHGERKEI